jgi:hypothetical protein
MAVKFSAYDIQHVQHFSPWLEKHGHLLKSLQLNLNLTGEQLNFSTVVYRYA